MLEADCNGHLTILFTDVEGSTRRWETALEQMAQSLSLHDQICRNVIAANGGYVFSVAGDSFGALFSTTDDAFQAATRIQRDLDSADWPGDFSIRVRMSLHCGDVIQRDNGAYGPEIVRAALLCEIGHAGQILLSDTVASKFADTDKHYLGCHRLRKISEPQEVYQYGRQTFAALRNVITKICTIPASRNSVLGRSEQLTELAERLESNRLLTLTGPGGVGKTRLATELALRLFEHDFDGAYLVELAGVTREQDVAAEFARGLELTLLPDRSPVSQILALLDKRRSLLLVDNCEHLSHASAAIIDDLLRHCQTLSVIATSREALELDQEAVWRVPTLAPGPNSAATQLFLRIAQNRTNIVFDTPANRRQIDRICEQLDGLPLAIELAAARTRSLSLTQISDRLGNRQALALRSGRHARRKGTLNDVVAWSHDMLDQQERTAFRRMAIFTGGFSLEDLPTIIEFSAADCLELVDALVSRSLLEAQATSTGALRMRLLNTIQAFACEQLEAAGETRQVAQRHCQHFVALAEQPRHPFLPDPESAHRHRAEYANLRAAADWAIEHAQPALAARIATGCVIEIDRNGQFENGIRWSRAVAGCDDQTAFNARVTEAFLRGQEGNLATESRIAEQALAIAAQHRYRLKPVAISLAALASITTDPAAGVKQLKTAYTAAADSDQPLANRAFIDVHMATYDLLYRRPEKLLKRLSHYRGGMINYARLSALLLLNDLAGAADVVTAAQNDSADAWLHFNDLSHALYLIANTEWLDAAQVLVDAASRDSGLRRWQDGDFLVHFALLQSAAGDARRADFLIDNCRSRHGLIGANALALKQRLRQWPPQYDDAASLQWLAEHYAASATSRILARQPGLLSEEIQSWQAVIDNQRHTAVDRGADS